MYNPEGLFAKNSIPWYFEPDMGLGRLIEALKMCLGNRNSPYPRYENWEDDPIPHLRSHKHRSWDSKDQNMTEPMCRKCQGRSQQRQVVYVPGPVDPFDRQMAAQRDLQIRRQTVQADLDLNLPISIQRSQDGEEGYTHSQRLLQTPEVSNESVRPPPNRTICEGEPPPPYRSNSVGLLDKPSARDWSTHSVYGNYGNSQYFAPSVMSDNNNTRSWNTTFYGMNGSSPPDPYSLLPCQPDTSQSQAASPRPPNTLADPASGHYVNSSPSNNSQSTSSQEQLGGQASSLPTYDMVVGKTESES